MAESLETAQAPTTEQSSIAGRLSDEDVRELLARIDSLLGQVEQVPGPTADAALEAVQSLTQVYGEALARVMAAASPPWVDRLLDDELCRHLLVLHGLHPQSVLERVQRAVADIAPLARATGAEVELLSVRDDVATIRVGGGHSGCGSSAAAVAEAVTDAVLALAPEIRTVEPIPADDGGGAVTFIPMEALQRPLPTGSPT